ncbi:transporter substrate-binding domain-containing protein [Vibrio sp. JPW-9-11-11]|uniref:GGDEF domain-containing protein n=1 Tax=Vibrio sp. JPW-9-11-11 TaxID=1416532 RepID=UPI001593293E|nr:GGDEF domain-containing protein [Vibrio sp. JPW-9-11-11]NVD06976.1 transporter substrate-binding domain-containing protein [Vibrio sp. JPW-9-11-11]
MALFWRAVGLILTTLLMLPVTQASTTYKVGIEADDIVTRTLFDAAGQHFNLDIEYVYYPSFDAILNAVERGESDFAANVTYTEQRAARFDFSSPTNIEYTYLYSITNATLATAEVIGVPKGTVYAALVETHYPHIKQVEYSGHQQARNLIEARVVDGVIDAINQLKPMLMAGFDAQLLNHQIPIKPVSIITPKGRHQALLSNIVDYIHSAEIQKMLRESVKTYQFEIRQQALRQSVIDSGVNINRHYRVKLHNVGQYAEYRRDGEIKGISADVVQQACQILLLQCDIVSDADESWESMYQDLVEKRIDILAPIVISEQRKALMEFSEPYYFPKAIMIKREGYKDGVYSNVSELIVEDIGVMKDDFFESLLSQLLPNKHLKSFTSTDELYHALLNGDISYMAISRANFNKMMRESGDIIPLEEDAAIGQFYQSNIAIGFAKNRIGQSLAPLFSRAIKIIDTNAIIDRYDAHPNWKATLQAQQTFSRYSQIMFLLVLGFLMVVAMYLHSQSNTDPLTRLKNRRAMHQNFRGGVNADETVFYLDVNRFKPINDSYGHEIGDQVLKSVAAYIDKVWHGQSFRVGGDEFILIGKIDATRIDDLQSKLTTIAFVSADGQLSFDISVAIGISPPRATFMSLQEVLNEADEAMYRHKHGSKTPQTDDQNQGKVVHYLR